MFNPAYHRFRIRLLSAGFNVHNERLAVVVGLSARVKNNDPSRLISRQMGESKSVGHPYSRIADYGGFWKRMNPEELFPILSRTLPLLGNTVNLLDLADSVYGWNDYPTKRWALDTTRCFLKKLLNHNESRKGVCHGKFPPVAPVDQLIPPPI